MVAETAYPYTSEDGDTFGNVVSAGSSGCDFRYDISVDGQAQCLTDVFQAVANTGNHGIGAFYWEPAWLGVNDISWSEQKQKWESFGSGWATDAAAEYDKSVTGAGGSSYDNQALFDFSGKPLDSLKVFSNIYPKNENIIPEDGSTISEGLYRIRNLSSGLYLTVSGGTGAAGRNVVQYTADGAAEYNSWYIRSAGDGYYEIYSALGDGTEYLLDLDYGKTEDGTNIGIYTNTNADAQKFKFVETDNGYVIVTKSTGDQSAVVISESDTTGRTNGGNAHQSARTGSTSQVWVLEPVEELVITGDLNGDERVDSFDIILLRRCISGLLEQSSAADYNSDGVYNVSDLVGLESFLIGKKGFEPKVYGTPKNTIFPYDREPQP